MTGWMRRSTLTNTSSHEPCHHVACTARQVRLKTHALAFGTAVGLKRLPIIELDLPKSPTAGVQSQGKRRSATWSCHHNHNLNNTTVGPHLKLEFIPSATYRPPQNFMNSELNVVHLIHTHRVCRYRREREAATEAMANGCKSLSDIAMGSLFGILTAVSITAGFISQ